MRNLYILNASMVHSSHHLGYIWRVSLGHGTAKKIRDFLEKQSIKSYIIIDLRNSGEIKCELNLREVLKFPINDSNFVDIPKECLTREDYLNHYHFLRTISSKIVDKILELLNSGYLVIVGCQLGRDRTGVVIDEFLLRTNEDIETRCHEVCSYATLLESKPIWLTRLLKERNENFEHFLNRNRMAVSAQINNIMEGN